MNTNWADLNRDGRRLERLIKWCESNLETELDLGRKFGYFDRLLKATHEKREIVDIVLGVKKLRKEAEKLFVK